MYAKPPLPIHPPPSFSDSPCYISSLIPGPYASNIETLCLLLSILASNLWTGARGFTKATSSDTGNTVSVGYGSGQFSGEEYIGTVTLGGLTVSKQSFGGASSASGFNGVDGILGLGPVGLTKNTVSNTNLVPTFLDNLYSQGSIATEVIGVSFRPESGSDNDDVNGELTLGGIDSSKYSGSITYFPTLKTGAASSYWGISVSGFSYGSTSLGSGTGIVDTGTTLIYLPTAVYNKFLSASGASASDSASVGLATYSKKPTANFQITIGSTVFTLTPSQYLIPKEQYSQLGISSSSNKYYAWISDGGRTGVNTIIGQKFLEYYYSVYDTTNARIGFAPAI